MSESTAGTAEDPSVSPPTSLGKSPPSKLLNKCRPSLIAHLLLPLTLARVGDALCAARGMSGVVKAKTMGVAVAKPIRAKHALMLRKKTLRAIHRARALGLLCYYSIESSTLLKCESQQGVFPK